MSSVRTGAKTHLIANQKRGYIEKYVNIIYALGSAHVKFDVSSKSIFCRSIRRGQSNRTAESTYIQKSRSYIDSYTFYFPILSSKDDISFRHVLGSAHVKFDV